MCAILQTHTGISAGINALRSVKAFANVKLENLTWVLTLAHGILDILIKIYHFLLYQGYLRSAKVFISVKLENLTWDGFHGLGWLEKTDLVTDRRIKKGITHIFSKLVESKVKNNDKKANLLKIMKKIKICQAKT